MILCVFSLLVYWDLLLKVMKTISTRWARSYLDRVVWRMAEELLTLAKVYGGLTVNVDPNLRSLPAGATLVCSNHQSVADIAVLIGTLRNHRLRFVAKKELARGFPAVSEVLKIQRHALIDREGGYRSTIDSLVRLARRASDTLSPVVFPEGTRSRDGRMKKFQEGAIRTILGVNPLPVTAIAIDGGWLFHSMGSLRRGLSDVVYRVKHVGTIESTSDKSGIQEVVAQCRELIERQIEAWHRDDRAAPASQESHANQ